jgi:transposase-like protein
MPSPIFAQSPTQREAILTIEPIDPQPAKTRIFVDVSLFNNVGRGLSNKVLILYVDGQTIRRIRTDDEGWASISIGRDWPVGEYEVEVKFPGTQAYPEPVVAKTILKVRPINLVVETFPPLANVQFIVDGKRYATQEDGLAHIELPEPGTYHLETRLTDVEIDATDTRIEFERWRDATFTPDREVTVNGDKQLQIGFILSHKVGQSFVDLNGEPVDDSRISELKLKSSYGSIHTYEDGQPRWLRANRIARRTFGLEVTDVQYSVESVIIDGTNVVNRYQQRYFVEPDDTWETELLLYYADIRAKDALFGFSLGSGIMLEYPNGKVEMLKFGPEHTLRIGPMARGDYKMQVTGVGGIAPQTPVALSRYQDVELKVLTVLDMALGLVIGLTLSVGLLFYGRPQLAIMPKRIISGWFKLGFPKSGTRQMIPDALEMEQYVQALRYPRAEQGRALMVPNGKSHHERTVQPGAGSTQVHAPRVHDRRPEQRVNSKILPPYMRRSPSLEEALPVLYLRGLSTGDFSEALAAFLGPQAAGFSATTIPRLLKVWQEEYDVWRKRSLQGKDYVYIWADGVYFNVQSEKDRLACLVIIGVLPDGRKEVIAIEDGYRESTESWASVLGDLKRRGMPAPILAVGDGGLGFWAALNKVYQETQEQRSWKHKIGNVLDKLPNGLQPRSKEMLHEIKRAPDRQSAVKAITRFSEEFAARYSKAVETLTKDQDQLLTFFDFPAEHWIHLRTTHPVESRFVTVKARAKETQGAGSRKTGLAMALKLLLAAEQRWRRLNAPHLVALVEAGVKFPNGQAEMLPLEPSDDSLFARTPSGYAAEEVPIPQQLTISRPKASDAVSQPAVPAKTSAAASQSPGVAIDAESAG